MALMTADSDSILSSFISDGVVLVDYGAPWCPPCKTLLGVLEKLDQELAGEVSFVKVDCEELPAAASAAGVMSMPTVIVYKNGLPMDKLVGLRSKEQYKLILNRYL